MNPPENERLYVWRCPECGEQIIDAEYSPSRGRYYGHYHDAPEDWPHDEDPWFDAKRVEVVEAWERDELRTLLSTLTEGLREIRETAQEAWVVYHDPADDKDGAPDDFRRIQHRADRLLKEVGDA